MPGPSHGIIIWFVIFDSEHEIWKRGMSFGGKGMSLLLRWRRVIVISIKTRAGCFRSFPTPIRNHLLMSHLQPLARINYFYYLSGVFVLSATSFHRSPLALVFSHLVFSHILIAYRTITILHFVTADWRYLLILDATGTHIHIYHWTLSCPDPIPNLSVCECCPKRVA